MSRGERISMEYGSLRDFVFGLDLSLSLSLSLDLGLGFANIHPSIPSKEGVTLW